jgi:tetratricopeptide (TPR) repeat protein
MLVDHPEDPLILELAGTVAEFQDDDEAALEFFNKTQVVAPFRPSTIHGLVSVYRKSDSSADLRNLLARAVADKAVHANLPEPWVQIHLDFALTLSDDGHHKEAASTILALTGVRNADRANLFYNLAGIFERAGREDDVRNALERAIEAAPRRPVYKERLADFLVQRQLEPDTALQLLVAANEVETTAGTGMFGGGGGKAIQSPNRARYLFKIARVYFLKGEDAEAEKIITTGLAISREPQVTQALESLREEIRAAQSAE